MEKALFKDVLKPDAPALASVLAKLRRDLAKVKATNYRAKVLAKLSPAKRRAYEQVFAHLYECSTDKAGTKLLVDRILARLARSDAKKRV
jgi:hypothetical protein